MFSSMLRLVEQQNSDGAIRHAEFDPAPSQGPFDPAGREEMIRFIDASTPARHKFDTADGRTGVVYFDTRGRAVSAVLDDLGDDTLGWIAQSRDVNGNALPAGTSVQAEPVEESKETPDGERTESLTPKSRTAIEKFVFSKMPPDSKMKKAGKMQVMFTGSVAKAAGAAPHSPMMIGEMDDQALISVAKLMGYVGVTESADLSNAELAKAHVTVARDAMEPTMKVFSVSFDDMSEDEFKAWLKKNKIYGRVSKSNKGFSAYVESATVESVTFDVIGAPFTKWIASLKKAMSEFDVTSYEAMPAGNVRAVINMVVNGKKLTMVVDGTKKYGTNAESATPTNSWITVGSQKIWGGSAIKDALGAVRQALEAQKG